MTKQPDSFLSNAAAAAAIILCVATGTLGCAPSGPDSDAGESPAARTEAAPAQAETSLANPKVQAILAAADLADGAEDHVVAKCAGCALAMDGKAEHSLKVADYEMHFCSDHCRDGFAEAPAKALVAMADTRAKLEAESGAP